MDWKKTIWAAVERIGIPTVLLFLAGFWMSQNVATPLVESHRVFLAKQIELGQQYADSLVRIEQIVSEDKAERKSDKLDANKTAIALHDELVRNMLRTMQEHQARQTAILEQLAKCIAVGTNGG